jgi:hypothetical protein
MAMEVHGASERDMDHFIKECAHHLNNWEIIYLCIFAFNFSSSVLVLLFNMFYPLL